MLARARHRASSATARRAERGSLLVANHVSWLDILAIHAVVPRGALRLQGRRARRWPLVGAAGRLRPARSTSSASASAMRCASSTRSAEALRAGAGRRDLPRGNDVDRPRPAAVPRQPAAGGDRHGDAGAAGRAALLGSRQRGQRRGRVRRRDQPAAQPVADVVRRRRPRSRSTFLPPRASAHVDRRELAALLRADIAGALGIDPTLRRRRAPRSPSARLVRDRGRRLRRRLGVAEVVAADRLERVVELVDERDAVRDVEADDLGVADAVEVLDERAHAVAVRRDEHALAGARSPARASRARTAARARRCPSGTR